MVAEVRKSSLQGPLVEVTLAPWGPVPTLWMASAEVRHGSHCWLLQPRGGLHGRHFPFLEGAGTSVVPGLWATS